VCLNVEAFRHLKDFVTFYESAAVDDEPVPSHLKTAVDRPPGGQVLKKWRWNVKEFIGN